MSKIKVLLLLHELSLTGAPKVILDAFEQLEGEFEVRILAPNGGPLLDRCRALGKTLVPTDGMQGVGALAARTMRRLTRGNWWQWQSGRIRQWEPDLIYVNSAAATPMLDLLTLPEGTPILLHVHELQSLVRYYADRRGFRELPARYLAVSEAVERCIVDEFGVAAGKVTRIPEFVPLGAFAAWAGEKRAAAQAPFTVGGAGSACLRKGVGLWAQMAAELRSLMPEGAVQFCWVGVSEHPDAYLFREMIAKMGLADCVELVPVTPRPLEHFRRFDVFAMTSWEDPCPIVVLENMMLQTPVACFAGGGGAPEEVDNTGIVVERFDPAAMARGIASLLAEPERLRALGEAARHRAVTVYSDRAVVPALRDVIIKTAAIKDEASEA